MGQGGEVRVCLIAHVIIAIRHTLDKISSLDGWSTVDELIERTIELGYPSLTITDHGCINSHLELGKKAERAGLRPIFGIEAYNGLKTGGFKGSERDQAHLIIGAYDDNGLKNLWRLSDKAASNFRFVPRVTFDMLKEFKEGLWATSACIQGLVSKGIADDDNSYLDQYLEAFRDNFYIEIHTYPSENQKIDNMAKVQIARERGLPLIWASDAHMARRGEFPLHDAYLCMQMGDKIDTPIEERKMYHPPALYIKSEEEIREDLAYLGESVVDECIRNSFELSEKCTARLPEIRRHLPVFIPSESKLVKKEDRGLDAKDLLIGLAVEGAYERYGEPSEAVWERLRTELDVLIGAGLEHYILQVWEICSFADSQKIIRGPGRGSSASSLLCFVLKITDIDALKYNLYFERFYNIGREKGLPDIDIDFSVAARKKIKEFVINRWGKDKVENIGTTMRLKPIVALNRTWNVFGIEGDEFSKIRKIVGKTPDIDILGADSIGWSDKGDGKTIYVWDHVGDEIEKYIEMLPVGRQEKVRAWLDFIDKVVGRVSGYGIHPSGVVVSDVPINEELPRMWSANSEAFATQFPMDDVGKRMFVKDDLLGIRNLDTLEDWQSQMRKQDVDIEWSGLENQDHPDEMWEMLERGLGTGIFQIEDQAFPLELCKRMRPRSIEDLGLIVALNRPGPRRSGAHERYIARRNGEPVVYDDPFLEDILKPTLGEFIFQESVITLFNKLGYTPQEADAVRSILGKKDPEGQQRLYEGKGQWKGKGYLEMARRAGLGSAQIVWEKIEGFSKYAFNLPHAISYAIIGFRTLFAKYWGPKEFILACIRTNPDDKDLYIAEGRRLDISVNTPHIARSDVTIGIVDDQIYLGLSEIKGLSKSSSRYVLYLRDKYGEGVYSPQGMDECLALENEIWMKSDPKVRFRVSPRTQLKSSQIGVLEEIGAFDDYVERGITDAQRRANEKKLLGIALTENSKEIFLRNLEKIEKCDPYSSLDENGQATIAGMISNIRPTQTKAGKEDMAIVTIEYGSDSCRFAVFPRQYKSHKHIFSESNCAILTINRNDRGYSFVAGHKLT